MSSPNFRHGEMLYLDDGMLNFHRIDPQTGLSTKRCYAGFIFDVVRSENGREWVVTCLCRKSLGLDQIGGSFNIKVDAAKLLKLDRLPTKGHKVKARSEIPALKGLVFKACGKAGETLTIHLKKEKKKTESFMHRLLHSCTKKSIHPAE